MKHYADKKIVKEIIVKTDPETVWEKWTSKEGITSFFAPDCKIELKIGGAFEMYFIQEAEYGGKGSEGCKILSFLPYQMLSFSWNAPPQFAEIRNNEAHTWVVLEIRAVSQKFTHIQLTHLGWQDGEAWQDVYNYFNIAWEKVLNNLELSLKDNH